MTTHVTDEVLGKIARQQNDLFRRVREGTLNPDAVSGGLQDLIEAKFSLPAFQRDMSKEGWELVEDVGGAQLLLPSQLKLTPFLKGKEISIKGDELVKRAKKEKANLGQRQAEYLLEHQGEIPTEWRQYFLVFPGTIWRDRNGHRYVPYLDWFGGRWYLRFGWLAYEVDSNDRLLSPRE